MTNEQIASLKALLDGISETELLALIDRYTVHATKTAEGIGLRLKAPLEQRNPADAVGAWLEEGVTTKATAPAGRPPQGKAGAPGADITAAQVAALLADPAFARQVQEKLAQKLKRSQQGTRGQFENTVKDLGF